MANNKSLQSRLKRLFSTNVIVRNVGKKRLVVKDMSHYQSSGSPYQTKVIDRYGRIHGRRQHTVNSFNQSNSFLQNKIELYHDYEAMDADPIIHSALDIYADESTVRNEYGEVLSIKTKNDNIKKVLENLFYDILNIDFNIGPWVRSFVKYGDLYLWMDIQEKYGVVNVQPFSAYEVTREEGYDEEHPQEVRFVYEGGAGKGVFENFEIAHFRLLGDTNFLPYGTSILEGARRLHKQILLMEDAMLIHRIMRAPEKRVFKIDVGNLPPQEIDAYMQQLIDKMKKVPLIDQTTGQYNLKYNMQNLLEDYFLPVRGQDSTTNIENISGLEYTATEDIEYLQKKLFAALKIPKAFLGYEEDIEGKATLAAEDVRFARTIERIQRTFVSELTKIAIVHLYAQGYEDEDLVDFELEMTSPSIIYEQERIELMKNKVELASNVKDLKMYSNKWIYETIFGESEKEWTFEKNEVVEDTKQVFRLQQIENEGNDPALTNESYGTPHDLASIGMNGSPMKRLHDEIGEEGGSPEGGWEGAGRPAKNINYRTDKSRHGRDPMGSKRMKDIDRDTSIKHNYKGNHPLSMESIEKRQKAVAKTFTENAHKFDPKSEDVQKNDVLNNSDMLNESNIRDDGTWS